MESILWACTLCQYPWRRFFASFSLQMHVESTIQECESYIVFNLPCLTALTRTLRVSPCRSVADENKASLFSWCPPPWFFSWALSVFFLSSLSLSLGSLDSPLLLNCLNDYEMHCWELRTDLRCIVSLTSCLCKSKSVTWRSQMSGRESVWLW